VGLATPYVLLVALAGSLSKASGANALLVQRAAALHWSSGLGWVARAYPPIPLALARLVPGGARSLAVLGALCTGWLLQLTAERLFLRSIPPPTIALLTASVALVPAFWFVATTDLSTFATLCFLSVALSGLLDFTFNRSTQSGFIAGIGFGLATMCSLAAASFALTGALAAFLVTPRSHAPREIARRRAAATVVLFPSAAAVMGWGFLEWRFTGSWTRSFVLADPALATFGHRLWGSLGDSLATTARDLAFTPLLVVATILLLVRRPWSSLAAASVVGCTVVDGWLGVGLGSPATVILLAAVSLVLVPESPSLYERLLLWSAGLLQVAMGFGGLSAGLPSVSHWLSHLFGGAG